MKKVSISEKKDKSGESGFSITGEMTIYTAAKIRAELLNKIKTAGIENIDFDLSEISAIDSAGLQLLLSSMLGTKTGKQKVSFSNPSAEVTKITGLYGLTI